MIVIPQICGLSICLLLLYFYGKQRRLKLERQGTFEKICVVIFASLLLDIISCYMLEHYKDVSLSLILGMRKVYLISNIWIHILGVMYADVHVSAQKMFRRTESLKELIFGIIASILVIVTPLYAEIRESGHLYTYGLSIMIAYMACGILLAWMFAMIVKNHREISKQVKEGAYWWVFLWVFVAIIEILYKDVYLIGFTAALALLVLYLQLENPERFLDSNTGFFNLNALRLYLKQTEEMKKSIAALYINYEQLGFQGAVERDIRLEVINYLDKLKKVRLFKAMDEGAIITFEDVSDLHKSIELLVKRFDGTWGKHKDVILRLKIVYLEDSLLLKKPIDMKRLFLYVANDKRIYTDREYIEVNSGMIEAYYKEENMENIIQESLEKNLVEVFYQPIYATESKQFEAAEALIRIRKEDGGLIMPGEFIEVAEKYGSIKELGDRVFEKVCAFIEKQDMEALGLHYIEINLSAVQCAYKNLAKEFIEIMQQYHVKPEYINLEITESASLVSDTVFWENIIRLKNYGVTFSIDDFGTGESNLNYVATMPVKIVKFDKGMVNAYFVDDKVKYVMDAAMTMIRGMQLEIVSEGVEKKEQLEAMEELGIQYIQGYYFSKPLEQDSFVDFVKSNQ